MSLSLLCRLSASILFSFAHTSTSALYTLSLHDALPICLSNYRDPAIYMGSNFIDDHEAFVACHSGEFSGRAACNDTVDTVIDRNVDDFSQYRKIDLFLSIKGHGKCREDSVKISSHIQS